MNQEQDIDNDKILPTISTPTKIFYQRDDGKTLSFLNRKKKGNCKCIFFSDTIHEFTKCPAQGILVDPSNVWRHGKSLKDNGIKASIATVTFVITAKILQTRWHIVHFL